MIKFKNFILNSIGILCLLFIWIILSYFGILSQNLLPSPLSVLKSFFLNYKELLHNSVVTFYEAGVGLFISVILSFIVMLAVYKNDLIYKIFFPIIFISQMIPIVSIAPLIVIGLGYGIFPKIIVVIINCFFPVCVSLINGMNSVDKDKINLLKTMGANKNQIFKYVILPSSRTHFFSGLKISVTYSIISAVIAEWLGGEFGIGIYMTRAKKSYQADNLISSIIFVCIISMLMVCAVNLIQKKRLEKFCLIIFPVILILPLLFLRIKPVIDSSHVTLVLDYVPNTNHTGIYVAKRLGYFKDEGISVDVKQPPQDGASFLVVSGKADFGIDFQDQLVPLLEKEDLSDKIKVLCTIMQHNTAVIISNQGSNILNINDLSGKTFVASTNPIEQRILSCLTSEVKDLKFINTDVIDAISTLSGAVDAMGCYYGWDVIAAKINNFAVNSIFYKDIDRSLDFYTPVVISSKDYLENNSDVSKKFIRALSRGYTYASQYPIESARILCEEVPELNNDLVFESQKYLSNEYISDAKTWGLIDKNRWNTFYKWLYDKNIINIRLDEKDVVCSDYLQ